MGRILNEFNKMTFEEKESLGVWDIYGWGLYTEDPILQSLGEFEDISEAWRAWGRLACPNGFDPEAPTRIWKPNVGSLYFLGKLVSEEGDRRYYLLILPSNGMIFIEARAPRCRWARISIVPEEEIPPEIVQKMKSMASH